MNSSTALVELRQTMEPLPDFARWGEADEDVAAAKRLCGLVDEGGHGVDLRDVERFAVALHARAGDFGQHLVDLVLRTAADGDIAAFARKDVRDHAADAAVRTHEDGLEALQSEIHVLCAPLPRAALFVFVCFRRSGPGRPLLV
jgi:hypothetical protein